MIINLSPVRCDEPLPEIKYSKDSLTVDGELFDFSPVPEGAILPSDAVESKWFVGEVSRIDGEIHLTLVLPHGANPSSVVAFPEPIRVTKAGAVKLPFDVPEPAEEIAHVD
ncbi:hypothetical protein IB239_21885 [Pseudomonas sp. PDM12]|uniref:hypothetical protein n=1 Tax=Pseudomonas sp. PDM12 TaxID=2769260 RepID=UPI00178658D6|nr:hypothetical protein [Pseudomonas sp. PDM12]MBD9657487.1 hypothetical protein [Pseudomonas sp. PDM12]